MPQITPTDFYASDQDLRIYDKTYSDFSPEVVTAAHLRAYQSVNSILAVEVPVPLRRDENGDFDGFVKDMEALYTLGILYLSDAPDKALAFNDTADKIKNDFLKGNRVLSEQFTKGSIGIQTAYPGAANRGSGKLISDTQREYNNSKVTTYSFEITTAGAVGTAIYKWKTDQELTWHETNTTSASLAGLEYGLMVRFTGDASDSFMVGDTWTIKCVPQNERQQGTSSIPLTRI